MNSPLSKDFIAQVLIESAYTTDEKVCQKYGISTKTLQRYRKALGTDSELSAFVHTKKKAFDEAWADEIPLALRKAIRFINEACDVADKRNPAVIERIAGAIKIIADVDMTGRWIDARIGNADRAAAELPREGSSEAEKQLIN